MSGKPVNKRVHRYDRFAMGSNVQRTPQGFLKIPATIARTGILEYSQANGSKWKELVLPEELHSNKSISTLASAPLTEDHHGMITPDNVSKHRVGHVSEVVTPSGDYLDTHLIIENRSTIDGISKGNFKELSAGYGADVEFKAGEWNGQHYDAIQRNRVYNHVAIGPAGWARGGSELSLHLDSDDNDTNDTAIAVHLDSKEAGAPVNSNKKECSMKKLTVPFHGVNYEIEVPEALASNLMASVDKLNQEREDSTKKLDSLKGELDAAKQATADLQAKYDTDTNPEAVEEAVASRVKLVEDCKKLHPEIEVTGKKSKELKIEALIASGFDKERFDAKTNAYVDGVFDTRVGDAPVKAEVKAEVKTGPLPLATNEEHEDAKIDPYDSDAARQRMTERNKQLCKPVYK